MSSSWPSCSTAGACEGHREGKGLPADHTAETGEAEAHPHHGAPRPGRDPAPWSSGWAMGERGRPCCAPGLGARTPTRKGPLLLPSSAPSPASISGMSPQPFFGGSTSINQISGKITSGEEVLARLTGHWDREVFIKEEGRGGPELFWNPSEEVRRQRLKRCTVLLEEQTELESERLWQHVTRAISEGDQHKATQEKFSLEEAQRQRARERQQNLVPWMPQLFHLDPATQEWRYRYENHSPWDPLKDIAQFEQDGVLHTLQRETTFLGSPGPRHQGSAPNPRLRKPSDQPSGHSQVTESSGSTPESCPELSDEEEEDGDFVPGTSRPC